MENAEIEHVLVSPQPEVTWIQVRRSCRTRIWKTSGDIALMCEGFTKQKLNLATDMRWCPILHKNSGLNTNTSLHGRNHTLHKDIFVTAHRTGPLGVILSKKTGPRIKVLVNPFVPETEAQNQDVAANHRVSVAAQSKSCRGTSAKCSTDFF